MALSDAEKMSLFEILEVPYATEYHTADGMGTLSAQTDVSGASQGSAKTAIESYLTDDLSSAAETRLQTYIARWDTLSTKHVRMNGGAVGQIGGVERDPEDEREEIRKRVKLLVPFYKFHEVLAKRRGGGGHIPLIR